MSNTTDPLVLFRPGVWLRRRYLTAAELEAAQRGKP